MPDGLQVIATSNKADVLARLDAFAVDVVRVASTRTVNKLADQAQTVGVRTMSRIYGLPVRTLGKYVNVRLAPSGQFVATIEAKGAGFPLYLFNPKQVRGKGGGVRVTLKGRTFLIPHAFIKQTRSGHVGIFARGSYGGKGRNVSTGERFGRFQFGRRRFSINELYTFGAPGAFSNPEVTDAMNERVAEQGDKVFAQEIRFASR